MDNTTVYILLGIFFASIIIIGIVAETKKAAKITSAASLIQYVTPNFEAALGYCYAHDKKVNHGHMDGNYILFARGSDASYLVVRESDALEFERRSEEIWVIKKVAAFRDGEPKSL